MNLEQAVLAYRHTVKSNQKLNENGHLSLTALLNHTRVLSVHFSEEQTNENIFYQAQQRIMRNNSE